MRFPNISHLLDWKSVALEKGFWLLEEEVYAEVVEDEDEEGQDERAV